MCVIYAVQFCGAGLTVENGGVEKKGVEWGPERCGSDLLPGSAARDGESEEAKTGEAKIRDAT